jgi:hypothetical protein
LAPPPNPRTAPLRDSGSRFTGEMPPRHPRRRPHVGALLRLALLIFCCQKSSVYDWHPTLKLQFLFF